MLINEEYWQKYWKENKIFKTDESKKKFYILEMFPYPSGDLHIGHLRNYVIGDVYARYYKMNGYSVLHPMGWDAFGLPAENAAIKKKISPENWTLSNISISKNTFNMMGISYDWDREVTTCFPDYYKWTQWLFIKLYEKGLAYRKPSYVNWCPSCKTVLANEQVENGCCYRCGSIVTKKKLVQWYFKITDYAERLLNDIDKLEKWPEKVRTMQKNWIGRSTGITVKFPLYDDPDKFIEVYTTRADTLFGVTFMALAPESQIVETLKIPESEQQKVNEYIKKALVKSDMERTGTKSEKDGVFTGVYVKNPLTGEKVEIFVADYVLASYGTGAVMGVPAHDTRDFAFSKKYNIPIKVVIKPKEEDIDVDTMTDAYIDPGIMINSDIFNGMDSNLAKDKIMDHLEERILGKKTVNFRLRDWLISRQRYWGAPIPMVHCPKCGIVPEKIENLPVLLPEPNKIDHAPKDKSPLASSDEFVETICPICGSSAKRDTDTIDTFVDSSWYFLRYTDAKNENLPFSREKTNFWMPVDLYVGGVEHAILHLLFSRFITKFLYDEDYIGSDEPFTELFTQGMVLNRINGNLEVMSKSKGNAVAVGPFVEKEGADIARATILFLSPPEKELEWDQKGVEGIKKFLKRIASLFENVKEGENNDPSLEYEINFLIKRVQQDILRFHLNTAISAMMEFINFVNSKNRNKNYNLPIEVKEKFLTVIAPFVPHIAEELWHKIGNENSIFLEKWISYDEAKLIKNKIEIPVQVNGKLRAVVTVDRDVQRDEIEKIVLNHPKIKGYIGNKEIRKFIYVPGKVVNVIYRG
jgi:leucyl-tRNA synthetase